MKILIYGAGAIGSVFGGFLAKAGEEVVMLGRPQHMETIKSRGLKIEGIWGDYLVNSNLLCYSNSPDVKEDHAGSFDLILITVKAYDTFSAASDLRNIINMDTLVLSLQNGIGNTEIIAKNIGADQALGGMIIFGAEIPSPGVVKVLVSADDVVIGRISQKTAQPAVEEIARTFTAAGIKTRTTEQIEMHLWNKILYNCALNALSTVLQVNYGQLLDSEYTKNIMKRVLSEIYAIAEKRGVTLETKLKEDYSKILFNHLIPLTASHKPSMLQDLEKRKKTEIDYLNGMISQMAKDSGISAPANLMLTELVKFKEKKSRI
ncbi:MAG: ketopantoate reductase family protein [Candidatus Margulisiibacteriota bacterium]